MAAAVARRHSQGQRVVSVDWTPPALHRQQQIGTGATADPCICIVLTPRGHVAMAVVLLCLAASLSSTAGAADPVSRALLQTEPELGQAAAAAAPAGKPYTEGSSWQVILGPVGAASNPPSGGISYTEFGGPDGIFTSSFNIFIQGFYVNDKNESTGTWYCSSVVNEKPAALTSLVRPTFAGQRLDTVTVVKQLSTSQAMTCMSGPENPKCTAQLKVRGKAKCLVNNKGVSQTCIRDEETLKSTARSASCEANTTASSVMVVADCGGKRWEVAPTQLLWGRTIVDPKP
ncbi:hypothetical protein OEZ85_010761 [Tetradesmus obliquus]|uniref:Pherophorin domain-containing protein n=1 Tax=Tetradesmus obliquus TaxID=3088 RepID=A0ABY8TNH9_TETOB|nr:hypothetical protein OEZ85_010761 [Tetradesmus obliquus]